jgi:hypothetical protein
MPLNVNGSRIPSTVRIQVGKPVGPAEFARDKAKPFTSSGFGVQRTFRESTQQFPPRRDPSTIARFK